MSLNERFDKAIEAYNDVMWVRALVAAIPYVGGSFDAIITSRAASIQRSRFERFVGLLREGYEQIREDKIDKAFLSSDEFCDLFISTTERVVRTHEAEKLKALRNAFVNATTTEGSRGPVKEIVIRVAGDISAAHVVFLRVVNDRESQFSAEEIQANENYTDLTHMSTVLQDASADDLEAIGRDLIAMGLLDNWWNGRYGGPNAGEIRFALTQFGRRFVWFINAPVVDIQGRRR